MSLKSLLSSKRASARLTHPFARYNPSGALSCTICHLPIKHENLWSAHLLSKGHRVNVVKAEKESEKNALTSAVKRKREEDGLNKGVGKKVKEDVVEEELDEEEESSGGLPADFFSDVTQRPTTASSSPEPESSTNVSATRTEPIASTSTVPSSTTTEPSAADLEWAAFEASLAADDAAATSISTFGSTIFAEPVMYEFGAPKVLEEGEEPEGEEEEEEGETEEEKAAREETEEKEAIMERIEEEEREQLEADEKVSVSTSF